MQILNIGIFAHIDAGKTTLLERILFETGKIRRPGTIEEGTTESDYLQEEIERGISIQSTLARVFWPNPKEPKVLFQFLDNPGHLDFQSQTSASLVVADLGIVLIDAFEGLKSQTLQNVEWLRKRKIPILFFLNKLDRKGIDITDSLVDLEAILEKEPVLLWKEGGDFSLLSDRSSDQSLLPLLEWDSELSEQYLKNPDNLAVLARDGFSRGFWKGEFFPVLGGAALHGDGVRELLGSLELLSKSFQPEFRPKEELGIAFKRELHPDLGRIVYIVASKEFPQNQEFWSISSKGKMDSLYYISTRDIEETKQALAREIIVVPELHSIQPGDVLYSSPQKEYRSELQPIRKQFQILLEPEADEHRDALWNSLQQLTWLDEGLEIKILPETGQIQLSGLGELHLEVSLSRLKEFYSYKVNVSGIKVARFELWKKMVIQGEFQHTAFDQKISSGLVQASLVSSNSFSRDVRFETKITETLEEAITSAFYEVVAKGFKGEEILGLDLIVHRYDPPDLSNETSSLVKVAVIKGLKDIIRNHTELIGPVSLLEILIPDTSMGDVLGVLSKRNAKIQNVVSVGDGKSLVHAKASTENLLGFASVLRNMTQGRGVLSLDSLFDSEHYYVITLVDSR
ncbi:elongation factor G-like protein [Leptospira kmetyi]|uniref:Elongation factor G-like protein n=1 Tax=Leptospira kmetyi TaxID=408139 RepID=A0A2M9XJP3_9LEPT|nr:elongation factor G-like protein [Leptospira kmetyi]AYV55389.1 elongation factor G-like protein [Leptospira kmetyi]PJZ30891.1 elongation factor G-like protein [Leptospira kmetyi]PJZ39458.1 elongation factor G-like protein [Leptospira kmetyi]TGK16812.1 elongation factor G-like protein [Leptospira kmetyi]TGK33097.1 elongation factor G-like protein [Leptospira kmetyi]